MHIRLNQKDSRMMPRPRSIILGVSRGVAVEPVDPEMPKLHACLLCSPRLAVDRHLGQDSAHSRPHLEPVPGESGPDDHVVPELAADEVNHEVLVRGNRVHAGLPHHRPAGSVHVVRHELLDPPGDVAAAVGPVAAVRVARRPAVVVDLDQASWELQRQRAVHVLVAVENVGKPSTPAVSSRSWPGLARQYRTVACSGWMGMSTPATDLTSSLVHALCPAELLAGARPHHNASLLPLPDVDDLRVVPDHGALLDGERLEHGHCLGRVQHAAAELADGARRAVRRAELVQQVEAFQECWHCPGITNAQHTVVRKKTMNSG
jgi:hypothetical protein